MADEEQLRILKDQGVEAWNEWREQAGKGVQIDLSGADLSGTNLAGANLSETKLGASSLIKANLCKANLCKADLIGADLADADLRCADLTWSRLIEAVLCKARLHRATLHGADLSNANFDKAVLQEADLSHAVLVETNFTDAVLTGCNVFGISAWKLILSKGTRQQNLVITRDDEPQITTDDIEVAQFIYLLLNNEKLREVIDTITSKVVLILGRFSEERKAVLDAVRDALRKRDLLPVIFDFSVPANRDVTETARVLFGLARFVIADITDATEVRSELNFVPDFPSLPVQPILLRGRPEPVGIPHWRKFPWFLPSFEYEDMPHLLANLDDCVLAPAEAKVPKLQRP